MIAWFPFWGEENIWVYQQFTEHMESAFKEEPLHHAIVVTQDA
jgi:hypothetical protein